MLWPWVSVGGRVGPARRCLSLEVFDLQYDFSGDGAFLVEHGVSEGSFGDGADFSGDPERELVDGLHGRWVEDGLFGACEVEVMGDVVCGFLGADGRHVVAHGDSLVERFHDGELHGSSQFGVTGEDEDEGVVGVHFEIGQESEFFEGASLEEVSFIDDEEGGFAQLLFGVEQCLLDLGVDGALGEPGWKAQEAV